jgi:hypothetical protein
MKTKRALIAISIVALLVIIVLISIEAYYVTIALIAGALIFGHRELWSLLTKRRLPPFDERVKENIDKSVRNSFLFFVLVIAFLLLPFGTGTLGKFNIAYVLCGLLVLGGLVYLLSYLYYDRVGPKLNENWLKLFRIFMTVAGVSVAVFIISVFLHNAIYALLIQWFGEDFWSRASMPDEPVFFFISVFIAPLGFIVGFLGSLVIYIKGLCSKVSAA